MKSFQQKAEIISREVLGPDIYRLTFQCEDMAREARPGQFVMVRVADSYDPLLRRPFSIHQVTENGSVQILFKTVGKGTSLLARLNPGEEVDLVGPLGNRFSIPKQRAICLVGGGLGIAPLLFLATKIFDYNRQADLKVLLGARTKIEIVPLLSDFELLGAEVKHATDDGSSGHNGLVTELIDQLIEENLEKKWSIVCCGPTPMMKAVARICGKHGYPCQVSLETIMACGVGACLGCAIEKRDEHSQDDGYLHACKNGPIFTIEELEWC